MVLATFSPFLLQLIREFGYAAVFLSGLVSASTIFLPFPLYVLIFFAAGLGLNPIAVGILTGLGSAIGELTGYFVGFGGKKILEERIHKKRILHIASKHFNKYAFAVIVLAAMLPFPFDFIGILSGASSYSIKKFFIATLIGKTVKSLFLAFAGSYTLPFVEYWIQSVY
jgi:membrane protein YqaA with SNARE-associated domain